MESVEKFVALLGAGYWGKNLLRNLYELKVLHTVCDVNTRALENFKEKYPGVNYSSSYEDILKNENIKAVVIATPAATHSERAKEALLADKDVFVEKPLALRVSEGEELVKLASERNKILMVGHILQYHPAVLKLKELIKGGTLGKIHYIYSNRLNIGKLRTEENILWSFAPHDISIILMLLEEEPIKVQAFGRAILNSNIHDVTLTTLEFPGGVKGHIFVSWLHPFKEQKLVVVGSESMVVFDDVSEEKLFVYPHRIKWKDGKIPVAHKAEFYTVEIEKKEPLKEEMKHFVECVLTRKNPRTDGLEGLRVLRILNLCQKALEETYTGIPESATFSTYDVNELSQNDFFLHPSSYVDEGVEIGKDTKIWHFSHILRGTKIGERCVIGQNVMIGPDVTIGNRCKIQNNVSVYKGVTLEDDVFCGPSCVFTNVLTPRAFIERKHEFKPTLVKKGATIGANATVVCGATIGRYALVGAGAVVTCDVPDYALYLGVPAKLSGWVCKCGVVLIHREKIEEGIAKSNTSTAEIICPNCKSTYLLKGGEFCPLKENI